MAFALEWDKTGERLYETGVSKGVLYTKQTVGEGQSATQKWLGTVWNGLTAVNEAPEGGEPNALYADDIKYLNLMSNEDFKATIEAYTYPDEFAECDGSAAIVPGFYAGQQVRKPFGLSYVTKIGNDEEFQDYGYKLHIVYNCLAAPTDKNYETINDTPDAITFSWEVSTTPENISAEAAGDLKLKPTAHLTIDSTKFTSTADAAKLQLLESKLYGTAAEGSTAEVAAELPDIDTVIGIMKGTITA